MKTCSVDGCNNKCVARGYCTKHYSQIMMNGRLKPEKKCSAKGCGDLCYKDEYCSKHYYLISMYGDLKSNLIRLINVKIWQFKMRRKNKLKER